MLKKTWKSSHILIAIAIGIGTIQAVVYTYQASNQLAPKEPFRRNVWLIGKGDFFADTIKGNYHHLVADFPLVELHPKADQIVTIQGYENGKRFLSTQIRQDTLFVTRAQPMSDTVVVAVDEDYAALVRVGAHSLRSITLIGSGHIDIPVNPYGANPGGPVVYKDEDWEKYVLRNKELDLHFEDGATGDFFLETETVNVFVSNKLEAPQSQNSFTPRRSSILLIGKSSKTTLLNPSGLVRINAAELISDTVIVRSNPLADPPENGAILAHCTYYLEASLLNEMDVIYKGQPRINKSERDFGRVVNGNSQ